MLAFMARYAPLLSVGLRSKAKEFPASEEFQV